MSSTGTPHPVYGLPVLTGRITLTNGLVWRAYKAGPGLTVRCSDDHRATLIPQGKDWLAFIDTRPVVGKNGERLRFVSREAAEGACSRLLKVPRQDAAPKVKWALPSNGA